MFSFIIINFNTKDLTQACLKSIFANCLPGEFEIILIDNNSRGDDVFSFRQLFGEKIKIIGNKKNLGFAAANNQGAKIASGEYLFFLNSDTLLETNILPPIRQTFFEEQRTAVIAPRLLQTDGREQAYAYGRDKISGELSWASGAALIIRREVFKEIGGWDERYFMYFEDVDLGRAVRKRGYSIKSLASSTIIHLRGGSPLPFWRRKAYYYRAKILFFLKYL